MADIPFKRPCQSEIERQGQEAHQRLLRKRSETQKVPAWFSFLQKKELFLRRAFAYLTSGTLPSTSKVGRVKSEANREFRRRVTRWKLHLVETPDGPVMVQGPDSRRVLWAEERFQAVADIHRGEGHYPGSREKTRVKVQERYFFPQMREFVEQCVKRCDDCQFEKAGKAPRNDRDLKPTPPTAPFYRVHVDVAGPFEPSGQEGFRYVGLAVDFVTKWVEFWPMVHNDSPEMAAGYLRNILHRFSGTFEVVTDNGSEFKKEFLKLLKSWGLDPIRIASRNPQANGLVERYVQVVKGCLRKCCHSHPRVWHIYLSGIAFDLRTTFQESIQMSPFQCLFGRSPVLPIELTGLPTRDGLVQPVLHQPESSEQRLERHKYIQNAQSMAKAQILGASIVQRRNFVRWNAARKTRTSDLQKDDLVLMRRPGEIKGHRRRWEGPYIFAGWLPGFRNKKAVLRDSKGNMWTRTSKEIFKYYPRLEFVQEYLNEIKAVDGIQPGPRFILSRFLEAQYRPPSFITLRLEQAIMKVRRLHGFLPFQSRPAF